MFDGLIKAFGYIIAAASGLTLLSGLLLAAGRRWGPSGLRRRLHALPMGCALPTLFLLVTFVGCGWILRPVEQPESIKTVAAYSIPLASESDRTEFLQILRAAAAEEKGEKLHVDATPRQQLEQMAKDIPQARMAIHAAVWKGVDDDEIVADAMDLGHSDQTWITFKKGTNPQLVTRYRNRTMQAIVQRWPGTLPLPVLPTGGIPLYEDLIRTPHGYIINPAAASKYALEKPQP